MTLMQIKAPYFTAGIALADNVVTDAAPIVKYMKGWHRNRVRYYCRQRGWQVAMVTHEEEA